MRFQITYVLIQPHFEQPSPLGEISFFIIYLERTRCFYIYFIKINLFISKQIPPYLF